MSRNREQARDRFLAQAGDKIEMILIPTFPTQEFSTRRYVRSQRLLDGGRVAEIPCHCDQVPSEDRDVAGLGADPHGVAVIHDGLDLGAECGAPELDAAFGIAGRIQDDPARENELIYDFITMRG